MARGEKDHGSNWLIQHHARSLLRLVGVQGFRSCRPAHARITLPQALPDGLLEVVLPDEPRPLLVLLEMEAYPSRETEEQLARDIDLAEMALGQLPDAVLMVMYRRGRQKQSAGRIQRSRLGWSSRRHRWKVLDLSRMSARKLLALDEVGLVPLLPLTRSRASPEVLLQQCKERIERQARPDQRLPLLTITAILASARFPNAEQWLSLLGDPDVLTKFPLYQKWMSEKECSTRQTDVVSFLEARFGEVPEELAAQVRAVADLVKLEAAIKHAAVCTSLADFRKRLAKS